MNELRKQRYEINKALIELLLTKQYNLNFIENIDYNDFKKQNYNLKDFLEHVDKNHLPYLYSGIEIILDEDKVDKNNFINNLSNYKGTRKKLSSSLGYVKYYDDYMTINIKDKSISTLLHELNHFASTIISKNHYGLSFKYKRKGIFSTKSAYSIGTDEGMTEYITYKQLKKKGFLKDYVPAYPFNFQYACCLSKIIGYENLQEYYYKKDVKGLYKELRNYVSKEEFFQFLTDTDYLFKNAEYGRVNSFTEKNVIACLKRCNKFMVDFSVAKHGINVVYNDIVEKIDKDNFIPMQVYNIVEENAVRKGK